MSREKTVFVKVPAWYEGPSTLYAATIEQVRPYCEGCPEKPGECQRCREDPASAHLQAKGYRILAAVDASVAFDVGR